MIAHAFSLFSGMNNQCQSNIFIGMEQKNPLFSVPNCGAPAGQLAVEHLAGEAGVFAWV
jgi:hypothetical protein